MSIGHINNLFKLLKISGKILKILDILIGVLGYADDTAAICEKPEDVQAVIRIVEAFCEREDIQLNGKKTVWMKLGESH